MSQPFVGQLLLVPYNFAPVDWFLCQGQLLPISEYSTIFNLIGTTYGGDGQSTFGLPDLRGRTPIHQGSNGVSSYVMGQTGGVETVTITTNQYPSHSHSLFGSTATAGSANPANSVVGAGLTTYTSDPPVDAMNPAMVGSSGGGSQPHDNLQPYLVLNWIISLFGVFPSQG